MTELYPLKFHPIPKERLWGGTKLREVLGKPFEGEQIGESWELSAVPGDVSVISNGPMSGIALTELIEERGKDLMGRMVFERFGREFPVLIKFIDASRDLSIQVHPGDELARKRHQSFGKNEMWYIMDADPGARLIVGFNKTVEKSEYQEALHEGRILDLMNYEEVSEGDTFMIETGTIHAIGAGVLLAEIQQTSDVTYRVYDFNRRDAQGNQRELHTELALDAMNYTYRNDFKVDYAPETNRASEMVNSPYFVTRILELDTNYKAEPLPGFRIFMCVEGKALIENEHGSAAVSRGETALVPAYSQEITILTTACKLLEVTL